MENLLAMPVRPVEVMLGKIIPYVGLAYVQTALILTVSVTVFARAGTRIDPVAAVRARCVHRLQPGDGVCLLHDGADPDAGSAIGAVRLLPSMMLSGFMFPFQGMPGWARIIGEAVPLTHALADLSRDIAEGQRVGADLAGPVADGAVRGGGRHDRRQHVPRDAGLNLKQQRRCGSPISRG